MAVRAEQRNKEQEVWVWVYHNRTLFLFSEASFAGTAGAQRLRVRPRVIT